MGKLEDFKDAVESATPGGRQRGPGRLPVVLLMAVVAGLAALASRLTPVRSAVVAAVSAIRTKVSALTGRADAKDGWDPKDATIADTKSPIDAAPEMSGAYAGAAPLGGPGSDTDTSMSSPADEADGPVTDLAAAIPADTEEGRPAGV